MKKVNKILFVCTDNTCRSIMAEAVMKTVDRDNIFNAESRGLVVLFPEPLNPKAVAVMKGNRMNPSKQSSDALEASDIKSDTLILTMTRQESATVKERFPQARVSSLGLFAGKMGDIEEPHGGSLADYGKCYEYIDLLVKLAAEILFREAARGWDK